MQNLIETPAETVETPATPAPDAKADKAAKAAAAKAKRDAAKAAADKAKADEKTELQRAAYHRAAGNIPTYAGLSNPLTTTTNVAIGIGVAKYGKRKNGFTPRMLSELHAARKAFGENTFPASGIDNAICAILINNGILSHSGATRETRDGVAYLTGPVMLKFTKAGLAYGKA